MYVPATPVQPAPALAPVGVVSAAPASIATPLATTLKVRSEHLNVLENRSASVTGTLLEDHRPGRAGRFVALQSLAAHGWKTLALAHTGSRGRFRLTFTPR